MIELSSVWYTYPGRQSPAVRELTLSIRDCEILSMIGRNASGKSTVCKIAAGLLKPDRGSVTVDRLTTSEEGLQGQVRRRIAMLQQNPGSQFVSVTVEREIASGPENLGFSPPETRGVVDELLRFFNLTEVRKHPPHALSGGQMQKVLLASLLAMRPRHLVLDEPTSYLDPLERRSVRSELTRVPLELGASVIWVTQFLGEALSCPRLLAIERGMVCFDGSPGEFLSRKDIHEVLGIENIERFVPSRRYPRSSTQ